MKTPHGPTGFVGLSRQRQACACSRRRSPQRRSSSRRQPEAGVLLMGASSSRRVHRGPTRNRERSRLLCATGALAAAAAAAARRDQRMAERFNGAAERLSACAPRGRNPSNATTRGMGKQQPAQQAQLPGDLEKHGDGKMVESTTSESRGSRRSARQAFEDCPLIEIVHFHECLRGELRSLRTNVQTLCRQMRDLHHKTQSAVAAAPSPRQQQQHHDGDEVATAPMTLELEGNDAERTEKTVPAAAVAAAAAAAASAPSTTNDTSTTTPGLMSPSSSAATGPTAESLPAQHLELEVRVQSQFQLLWAVFQSHSTAEDEVIWPALKEKARSSGGKLKLVNHGDGSDAPPPPPPAAVTAAAADVPSNGTGAPRKEGKTFKDKQQDDPSRGKGEATATDAARRAEQGEVVAGGGRMDGGGGGGRDGDGGQFGEAMIDEAEYTEEHHEEQLLFEGMQEVLTGLRNTRHSSVTERLEVVNGLGKKADEMCRHLMTHLDKEEESALPLIKHYFTGPEMGALVGKIMGKRPTELMQTILSMMINNLPEEEVRTVMGYMKHAVKDTYFEKWLASGGFQWPTNNAPSNTNSRQSLKNSVSKMAGGGAVTKRIGGSGGGGAAWAGAGGVVHRIGCAATGASTASCSGVGVDGGSCGHGPFHQAASRSSGALSADSSASGFAAMPAPAAATSAPRVEERRRGGGVKRQGAPLGEVAAGVGGGARRLDGCCPLDREFEGLSLRGGRGRESLPGSAASGAAAVDGEPRGCDSDRQQTMAAGGGRDGGAGLSLGGGDGEERRDKSCSVCSYIGRCPVKEPLTQMEFESAVKRLAHVSDLSTERKSGLVQMMRNHMYQGRKRPRPASNTASASSSSSSFSSRPPFATGGAWPPPAGEGGAAGRPEVPLVAPAKYYTSTQPDIEDSGGAEERTSVLPPTLFTPEELAPTYHCGAPAGGGAPGDGADAEPGGEGVGAGGAEVAVLGCPHYRRACKIRAPCCQKLFTCRLCHDQVSDHKVDREEVTEMLCMRCETLQPINSECRNPSCRPPAAEGKPPCTGRKMARYYCGICHLFDDAPEKDIYHCPYCNVCRLGKGLGVDYYHCMTCNACVSMNAPSHTCLSKSLESDCPICNNSLFTSTSQVKGLRCGHFMHLACYKEYIGRAESREFWYRCPICRKSMEDMREYFSQMDAVVASQPMPEAYAGWKTKVLCHDCERYTEVPYHFYYLKCGACGSYNTRAEENMPRVGAAVADLPRPTMLPPPPFSAPVPASSEIDGQSAPPRP